ncbi:YeeE/YedE family protein [Albimonas sp. CAU 1670]|uniref:YeeE/YedE family protein n=1 Tax=Albimonas sp. CAU 1670 TaxID=3032599 RepID=UPI0023DB0F36|nr:YeeE/YedE family protein [Albimonas sp. CAU 1670]MDF2232037.1 YeeE/YedE family protein [Albimonas sp. CAU 1670]
MDRAHPTPRSTPLQPAAGSPPAAPASAEAAPARPPQWGVVAAAALLLAALLLGARAQAGAPGAWAALLGAAAGIALYKAAFGFASAWRRLAREGRSAGVRAQIVLIGVACLFAWPLLAWGPSLGIEARGVILPMGLASAFGAFLFGLGMQLGGGCASGTLYVAGGGSPRMMLTLAAFVAGSVLATAHWEAWSALPRTDAGFSVLSALGAPLAMAALAALLAAAWILSARIERRAHGALAPLARPRFGWRGAWTPLAGALALAAVSVACLLALGRPWGITAGFALWGAKAAAALGAEPAAWPGGYWSGWRAAQLAAPVLADVTSVMNLGIVLGAGAAAGLAGAFAPLRRISAKDAATAVIGGLAMGYGARLAYGCNIGAYLGGLVSGSLHGLWWLAFAVPGSLLGGRLRARLGMDPPASAPIRA